MKHLMWHFAVGCGLFALILWANRDNVFVASEETPLYSTLWKANHGKHYLQVFPDHTLQYDLEQFKSCAVKEVIRLQALGDDHFALVDNKNPMVLYSQSQVDQVSRLLSEPLTIADHKLPATLEIWTQFQRIGQQLKIITRGFYFDSQRLPFHPNARSKWRDLEFKQVFNTALDFHSCEN